MQKGALVMKKKNVQTTHGTVRGTVENGVNVFRGIPFAKPPVGALRFHPPEEPEHWKGVYNATEFSSIPMQPDYPLSAGQTKSEDCLYLNVWAPENKGKPLPVMVWIYGGAFMMGSASDTIYHGTVYAQEGNVVFVSMNYRVGIFGFLHLADIAGEKYASSGNCGLLDQIAALKWVKSNIAAFGGDPNNVTVFGESAGAVSITNLLAMPKAKGLFQKAIIQSPADPAKPPDKATNYANTVLELLGITPNEIEKIHDVSAQTLLDISFKIPTGSFWPVIDGASIPDKPNKLVADGAAKGVSVIIGANRDEYAVFAAMDAGISSWGPEEVENSLKTMFKPVWPDLADYFKGVPMDLNLYIRIMSYASFIHDTLRYTADLSGHSDVWSYFFCYEHPIMKAGHGMDMQFTWKRIGPDSGSFIQIEGEREEVLSRQMFNAWIAFANIGNPNTPELPKWPRFDVNSRETMVFDLESAVQSDPQKDRRIWEIVTGKKEYEDVVLAMQNDMFSPQDQPDNQDTEAMEELPQKDGYYSVHDKIGDLLKNRETETIIYTLEDSFKTSDGKAPKLNKAMMGIVSRMSLVKLAAMMGNKFPKGALEEINSKLMHVNKKMTLTIDNP